VGGVEGYAYPPVTQPLFYTSTGMGLGENLRLAMRFYRRMNEFFYEPLVVGNS
jgi:hypothetical protein